MPRNFHEVHEHQLRTALQAYAKQHPNCIQEETIGHRTIWRDGNAMIAKRHIYHRSTQCCVVPDVFELIPVEQHDVATAA